MKNSNYSEFERTWTTSKKNRRIINFRFFSRSFVDDLWLLIETWDRCDSGRCLHAQATKASKSDLPARCSKVIWILKSSLRTISSRVSSLVTAKFARKCTSFSLIATHKQRNANTTLWGLSLRECEQRVLFSLKQYLHHIFRVILLDSINLIYSTAISLAEMLCCIYDTTA